MFEAARKHRDYRLQPMTDKGFEAAKAGKPLSAIEEAGIGPWDPASRAAWIYGWESGGGDIRLKIVVTERERLEQERAQLSARLVAIDTRLTELGKTSESAK